LRDRSPIRRALHKQLEQRESGKAIVWRGDRLWLGGDATLRVLYPRPGQREAVADDQALVAVLECAGVRVLFLSDSGFVTEQVLRQSDPALRCDVLVKGWHSKDHSGTLDFVAGVRPQAVICSALGFGGDGAVLAEWSRAVTAQGIALFRQDECGAVRIEIRDGAFALDAVATGQTLRSRAR
jgi:beta-lactamase superfamily II metal-dependent hydrolase